MAGDRRAGDIHMRAPGAWLGNTTPTFFDHGAVVGIRGASCARVIGVGQRDLAFAAGHGLDLVGIAALGARAMLATMPLSQVSVAASPRCCITAPNSDRL